MKRGVIFVLAALVVLYYCTIAPGLYKRLMKLLKECGVDAEGVPTWFLFKKKTIDELVAKNKPDMIPQVNRARLAFLLGSLGPFALYVLFWVIAIAVSYIL